MPLLLAVLSCATTTPPPVSQPVVVQSPPPVEMRCVAAEEAFYGDELLVDVEAVRSRWQDALAAALPASAPVVTPGNCNTQVGFDVARRGELFAGSGPPGLIDSLLATGLQTGILEEGVLFGGATTGLEPKKASKARLLGLEQTIGLKNPYVHSEAVQRVAIFDAGTQVLGMSMNDLSAAESCISDKACTAAKLNACSGPGCAACGLSNECHHGAASISLIAGRPPADVALRPFHLALNIAPNASPLVARVLTQGFHDGVGSVQPVGDSLRIAKALVLFAVAEAALPEAQKHRVVYLGFAATPDVSATMCANHGTFRKVVEKLATDHIVVAPAGNHGSAALAAPACFDDVVSVAGWGRENNPPRKDVPDVAAPWSNGATTADILGPGEDVPAAVHVAFGESTPRPPLPGPTEGDYAWSSGTSVAAAAVAAALSVAVTEKGFSTVYCNAGDDHARCVSSKATTAPAGSPPRLDLDAIATCTCP